MSRSADSRNRKDETGLQALLESLSKSVSDKGFENDPKKRAMLAIDVADFQRADPTFDPERKQIRIDSKLTNVRLETVLAMICDQMEEKTTFFVRRDCIEIVPRWKAWDELGLERTENQMLPRLIHRIFTKVPLEQALQQIAERYNQNIVIAPQAEAKKSTVITARLVNAPVDVAVETLANLADLKLVRKQNVLYVTTNDQAAELKVEQNKRNKQNDD
jgi:hypothetical protein